MTAAEALRAAIPRLAEAGISDAARDARRLLAHSMGIGADRMNLHLHDIVSPEAETAYRSALASRIAHQPVAQITGERLFYGRRFRVTRDTLDPRPETEALVNLALTRAAGRILDLGTGTGCILLTMLAEWPEATGVGTDLSQAALDVASGNADMLGLGARAGFLVSDWFAAVTGQFDLILSNPPYIALDEMADLAPDVREWEPHLALTDGADGLGAYHAIAAGAGPHLALGGRLMVEIGAAQGREVARIFADAGFADVTVHADLDGRDRVVACSFWG